MEDRHSLAQAGGLTIAAIFDGHGGDGSSSFCAAQIVPEIERAFRHAAAADSGPGEAGGGGECGGSGDPPGLVTSRMSSALRSCFVTLNARFLSCFPSDTSGCTALAVVVLPHVVLAANAGDCRAYLWREDGPLLPLSREHIASDEAERARVLQLGGAVQATIDGKLRVGGVIQVGGGYGINSAPTPEACVMPAFASTHTHAHARPCGPNLATLRRLAVSPPPVDRFTVILHTRRMLFWFALLTTSPLPPLRLADSGDALHRRPRPALPWPELRAGDRGHTARGGRPRRGAGLRRAVGRFDRGKDAPLPEAHGAVGRHAGQAPCLRRHGQGDR
eukprot:scaffold5400_cov116-Isochrysis_galbana.AAC.1